MTLARPSVIMSETVVSITQEAIDGMKCKCDDCRGHISNLLGALVYETTFCELRHKVLLRIGKRIQETSEKFDEVLKKKCDIICKVISSQLGYTVLPICLSKEAALKTPLETKFLDDIMSFRSSFICIAFKSHHAITIFTQKFAYAKKLAITRLSEHNPVNLIEGKIKHLLIIIATALKFNLDQLEQRRIRKVSEMSMSIKTESSD